MDIDTGQLSEPIAYNFIEKSNMFTTVKEELITALGKVFNLNISIDIKDKPEYQDCVLYVEIYDMKIIKKNNIHNNSFYHINGCVYLNLESSCGFRKGYLTYRASIFNKIKGLYFATKEIIQNQFTTLKFEYLSKEVEYNINENEIVKDIKNQITTKYK